MTKRVKITLSVDEQYQEWMAKQTFNNNIDEDALKETILNELEFFSSLTVEEYTLWRKWQEIRNGKHKNDSKKLIDTIKNNIWEPKKIDDYKKLKPVLVLASGNTKLNKIWSILRTFSCSLVNNGAIGRQRRFLVLDEKTEKYLGIICVSGDFMDLKGRDDFIGWTREDRTKKGGMLKHTANGSSIIPMQPFGYNYNGGKLIASLVASDIIEKDWEKQYGDKLVGVSTTSLYGSNSMYNSLKYWNRRGKTQGATSFEFSKETEEEIKEYGKNLEPYKYFEWWGAKRPNGQQLKRDHRNRSRQYFFRKLGFKTKSLITSHSRGVYFNHLFKNTNAFLKKEIPVDELERRFDNRVETLVDIWKLGCASKRVKNLKRKGTFKMDYLFYDDLRNMKTWEEVKGRYIHQIGQHRKTEPDNQTFRIAA
jgi:hypothetical protein